jgi:alkyldihydroxyacetonephosphate synthase
MDNEQFSFGQALQTDTKTLFQSFVDGLKKYYISKIKGVDLTKISVVTLLFEVCLFFKGKIFLKLIFLNKGL